MQSSCTPEQRVVLVLLALCLAASPAWANMGAAEMATMLHLYVGAGIIGLIEAVIVIRMGGRPRALVLMIAANYLTAWLGVPAGRTLMESFLSASPDPLAVMVPAAWLTMAALACVGAVIEWPFCWLGSAPGPGRFRRSLLAIIVASAVTNALLVLYYQMTWRDSLATSFTRVAPPTDISDGCLPPGGWVYFIGPDDRSIWRVRLDGTSGERVLESDRRLDGRIEGGERADGTIDLLYLHPDYGDGEAPPRLWTQAGPFEADAAWWSYMGERQIAVPDVGGMASIWGWYMYAAPLPWRTIAELRPEDDRATEVSVSWDGTHGILVRGEGRPRRLANESNLLLRSMTPLCVSVLPCEVLVFELNHENGSRPRGIYALSIRTNKIIRLADGRSPVVVFEQRLAGWEPVYGHQHPKPADD